MMINRDYSKDIEALRKFGVLILMMLGWIWTAVVWITKKIIVPILKWLWEKMRKYPVFSFVVLPIVLITIIFWEVMKIVLGVIIALWIVGTFFSGITLKDVGWWWFLSGGGGKGG